MVQLAYEDVYLNSSSKMRVMPAVHAMSPDTVGGCSLECVDEEIEYVEERKGIMTRNAHGKQHQTPLTTLRPRG